VKHAEVLFGLITVLGIALITTFLVATYNSNAYGAAIMALLNTQLWNYFIYFSLFGGISFLIVGLIGLGRQPLWNHTIIKHSRLLFGFIAALGIIFVTVFFTIIHWASIYSEKILIVEALLPYPYQGYFMLFSLIGGTVFLTIGLLGVGREYFKNHGNMFFLTAVLVPVLMLALVISITVPVDPFHEVPERMVITQVSLDETNPLVVSLRAKSFFSLDIHFVWAWIKDSNEVTFASIEATWVTKVYDSGPIQTMQFLGELPGGSEKTLTFDFNTTLPSGNYSVWLRSHNYYTFVSPYFTTP
jgi:hypothetical protein